MSDVVSHDSVKDFLKAAPHATYVDVADASHMVAGDRNDAFTEALLNFLQSEPVTSAATQHN
jgi:pimeloyl-ACP methyl ester carboxylesterase